MKWKAAAFVLLCGLVLSVAGRVAAQGGDNLLVNGSMEEPYASRGRADLTIPNGWSIWVANEPQTETWMNLTPFGFPHRTPPEVRDGEVSLNFSREFATFTAAVYQQVSVQDDTPLVASASAWLHVCGDPGEPPRETCSGDDGSGAVVRVGIDPNGGIDPLDTDVVWSAPASPFNTWGQPTVTATATGRTVTVFLYTTQEAPRAFNRVYWDAASLVVSEDAPDVAAHSTPQDALVVDENGMVQVGGVTHVVQPGDTLDAIAVQYGVPRERIMELNGLRDSRLIRVGQQLIIEPAERVDMEELAAMEQQAAATEATFETATPMPTTDPEAPAEPTSVPEAVFDPEATPTPLIVGDVTAGATEGVFRPDADEWTYTGAAGVEAWSSLSPAFALCSVGEQQSPVDLSAAEPGDESTLAFNYNATPLNLMNTGRWVMLEVEGGSSINLDGVDYDLSSVVLRRPSEHTLNNEPFPMAAQFVHLNEEGDLAIVSVLLEQGEPGSDAYAVLLDNLPQLATERRTVEALPVDLAALLPPNRGYFRYDGSLTIPPCTENVAWVVMAEAVRLSEAQVAAYASLYEGNVRPTQPLNGRDITLVTE